MKPGEKGYTLIELLVAITIIVTASGAAGGAIFQVIRNTQRNNDHMTAVRQVQNAGYWISRDAQMAQSMNTTDTLTLPNFLVLSWTEWNAAGVPTYHSTTYFFDNVTNGIGKLKRYHWSSAGANQTTLIADYIYYNPSDASNTSNVSYQSSVLTARLTALLEPTMESQEYKIERRPNF